MGGNVFDGVEEVVCGVHRHCAMHDACVEVCNVDLDGMVEQAIV